MDICAISHSYFVDVTRLFHMGRQRVGRNEKRHLAVITDETTVLHNDITHFSYVARLKKKAPEINFRGFLCIRDVVLFVVCRK